MVHITVAMGLMELLYLICQRDCLKVISVIVANKSRRVTSLQLIEENGRGVTLLSLMITAALLQKK